MLVTIATVRADPVFWKGGRQEEIGKKLFLVDNVVAPKALRCVARKATLTRGVRGHAPRKIFTISMQNGAVWRHFNAYFTLK